MRRMMVAGNWKMHGSRAIAGELLDAIVAAGYHSIDVAVFPPAVYLAELVSAHGSSGVLLGAQDVSAHAQGAYTGEISAAMLRDVGCTHVLVGHSERRQYHAWNSATPVAPSRSLANSWLRSLITPALLRSPRP